MTSNTDELVIDVLAEDYFDVRDGQPVGDVVLVEGPVGPPGPRGDPGATFDGTAWFYGNGAPATVFGSKAGDFYVDVETGEVYELE